MYKTNTQRSYINISKESQFDTGEI